MMVAMQDTSTAMELIPVLGHEEAMDLAQTEGSRMVDLLRQLQPDEWSRQTVCDLWNIRAMAGHLLGMAEFQASMRQFAHDLISAKRMGGSVIDGINATQVKDRSQLTPRQVVDGLAAAAPRALRARRRTPALMRNLVKMRQDPPFQAERWTYGYLVDTIFTRDSWIHRLDISRATGRAMLLTTEHDGRIVALIVAEWARRHGQPFQLTLTGPAGGRFTQGTGGDSIELDALDFCDTVAGRKPGTGPLSTRVPF